MLRKFFNISKINPAKKIFKSNPKINLREKYLLGVTAKINPRERILDKIEKKKAYCGKSILTEGVLNRLSPKMLRLTYMYTLVTASVASMHELIWNHLIIASTYPS